MYRDVGVSMVRSTLTGLPSWSFPPGFAVRTYRNGDAAIWTALHEDAEPYINITDSLFGQEFGDRRHALHDRMFFAENDAGKPVASITAWWQPDWCGQGEWGQIHWVVVKRAFQRLGLGKAMVAHALRRLAQDHTRAMLETATMRIWAIKVYLDAGFLPAPEDCSDPMVLDGWRAVQARLAHPGLAAWLEG
ncbi:MAG: GNAT family N-acetyltransferase [Caldilineaceae bacterium]|nr:GNAT family N-acetyltransferase [Caldilineaceae bacterium]